MEDIHVDETLDCRGLSCPMPMLKLKKTLGKLEVGKVVHMMGTDPGTKNDIEKNIVKVGNEFLGFREDDGYTSYYIKKG